MNKFKRGDVVIFVDASIYFDSPNLSPEFRPYLGRKFTISTVHGAQLLIHDGIMSRWIPSWRVKKENFSFEDNIREFLDRIRKNEV